MWDQHVVDQGCVCVLQYGKNALCWLQPWLCVWIQMEYVSHVLILLTAGVLAGLHGDDTVCARGLLHHCGLHQDDRVGPRQAPQLP